MAFVKNVDLTIDVTYLYTVASQTPRLKYVQARQMFWYFEVDTMQSGKKYDDLLAKITERMSRQRHIAQRVSGRNS